MSAPAANSVSWFEIGAPDVGAAKAFYGPLFGWSFAPDGAYTLITAPGRSARPAAYSAPAATSPRTRFSSSRWTTWAPPRPAARNSAARSSSRR